MTFDRRVAGAIEAFEFLRGHLRTDKVILVAESMGSPAPGSVASWLLRHPAPGPLSWQDQASPPKQLAWWIRALAHDVTPEPAVSRSRRRMQRPPGPGPRRLQGGTVAQNTTVAVGNLAHRRELSAGW
jgi:pimeloyl-ACP methyl ester carboxylesterase